jgi:hypothetical protein
MILWVPRMVCGRRAIFRRLPTLVAFVVAIVGSATAGATITCAGIPTYLGVGSDGLVYVDNGFGVWRICSLETSLVSGGTEVKGASGECECGRRQYTTDSRLM